MKAQLTGNCWYTHVLQALAPVSHESMAPEASIAVTSKALLAEILKC